MFKNVKWINNSYWSYVLFLTAITGTLQSAFWKYWKSSRDRIGHSILVQLLEIKWCDALAGGGRKARREWPGRCWMVNIWISAQTGQRIRLHKLIVRQKLVLFLNQYFEKIFNISSEKSSIKWVINSCISVANFIQRRSSSKCSMPVIHTLYSIKLILGYVVLKPVGMF